MVGCHTSAQIWKRISTLFATRSKARTMQYKLQLQTLKKGNLSMKDYLSKMKRIPPTVNYTTASQTKNHNYSHSQGQFNRRGRGYGRSHHGGRKGWSGNTNNRPSCQICGNIGHVAEKCFYRFDKKFVLSHKQHQPVFNQNPTAAAQHVRPFLNQNPTAAAAMTQSEVVPDEWWFPDSGTSHHVTNDISNLSFGSEYSGGGKIHMRDGTCLPITHIGNSQLFSSLSSRALHLNRLLRVPLITKNLISVSKFASDNSVFFEFHPTFCTVKDRTTGKLLLKGMLHEGLYRFSLGKSVPLSSSAPACFVDQPSSVHLSSNQVLQGLPTLTSYTLNHWHVKFDELSFPFASLSSPPSFPIGHSRSPLLLPSIPQANLPSIPPSSVEISPQHLTPSTTTDTTSPAPFDVSASPSIIPQPSEPSPVNVHPILTRSKDGIYKPKVYATQLLNVHEPLSLHDALFHSEWHQAMRSEYHALIQNQTWSLVPAAVDASIIGYKWVFKVKTLADGSVA
ncbi:uncharacterized protein [Primulina eburnea]|uniref:uncharacterized protein n=1 Tax=Primulina eburnea TaxID=1245227 RepID=UPI003C6CAE37